MNKRTLGLHLLATVVAAILPFGEALAEDRISGPLVSAPAIGHLTPALASLPRALPQPMTSRVRGRVSPPGLRTFRDVEGPADAESEALLGGLSPPASGAPSPAPVLSFDGQGNDTCGCVPPDTVGDVGPNHYVQMVNATGIAIYNKAGQILPGYPKDMSSLFAGGNCAVSNRGDPVVLHDSLADRWLLAQFSTGNGVCVAISRTPDPTGAYFGYEFLTPNDPDYLKFGVWPDGYYMSTNEYEVPTYAAYALDRGKMLRGLPAQSIRFGGVSNFMLPSDLDGRVPPPAGSPNYFYTFKDNAYHGTETDRLEIRSFRANFADPANSTFALTSTIDVAPFRYTVCGFLPDGQFNFDCIPQKGTAVKLDAISEWPMFRFPYRNFGEHESLAGTFTVEGAVNDTGAVRWFELRKTGPNWTLHQEGKIDSRNGVSRWVGSIAMDVAGNLALGYSVSSPTMFPAIRYAVHRIGDALGTMQPEATLIAGGGSQTGFNRWGDYSAMTIDPVDGATFWYTNQYYRTSSFIDWSTRIGAFRVLQPLAFRSIAANDGAVTELSEAAGTGGSINSTSATFSVGDNGQDRQIRAILDFNTAALPDNAVIARAVLQLTKVSPGTSPNPFTNLGQMRADVNEGAFSGAVILEPLDFQAPASAVSATGFLGTPRTVLRAGLRSSALSSINRTGHTQVRLRFVLDDDDDRTADLIRFHSGDAAVAADRPRLEIGYYLP